MDTEKRSLRAEVKALEDKVDALVAELTVLRDQLLGNSESLPKPRPTETYSAWNSRLNAGTH